MLNDMAQSIPLLSNLLIFSGNALGRLQFKKIFVYKLQEYDNVAVLSAALVVEEALLVDGLFLVSVGRWSELQSRRLRTNQTRLNFEDFVIITHDTLPRDVRLKNNVLQIYPDRNSEIRRIQILN